MTSLKNRVRNIFATDEFTEPIFWIYSMLEDAVVHRCDTFVLDKRGFSWHKEGRKIGEFKTYGLNPIPSFQETLDLIIHRDTLIRRLLIPYSDSAQKSIYHIDYSHGVGVETT